ncbi:hypothetical protein DH09_10105 [Bacillaceae bacterium JMAK1]|nr:hypothetical protein DH09_10105 [Bacillaceae bacterium JMAK1]
MDNISKKNLNIMKWVSGGGEALLGIPFLGGSFILAMAWVPLFVMLAIHVLIVVFAIRSGHNLPIGNIIGIGASILGFIPGLGMALHIVAAVFIFMESYKTHASLNN